VTVLVVSPHLDDAALSVPAFVRSRAVLGERVVVLTVFSEGDDAYDVRRDEDRAALALLGAEPVHLGLRDGPYRRDLPRTFRGLVLTELADGDADATATAGVLVERVAALAPRVVLLPLGVGEHIDHRVVHAAHARLARLGATVDGASVAPSRVHAEEYVSSALAAPYVRAYLPDMEREACLRPLAAALSSPAAVSGLALRRERFVFDRPALEAAAFAVRAYASQIVDLFGGDAGDVVTALAAGRAPYEETVYWRADPRPLGAAGH
jgi:LmbE family N-acetylglucosaminyl deacetylase